MSKNTIVFDFDGVIHKGYDGWKDGSIYGEIDYELLYFIKELLKDYYVVISSNRPAEQIVEYLNNDSNISLVFEVFKKDLKNNMYWNKDNIVGVTNEKAIGILYIDDRGYRYNKNISTNDNIENIKNILLLQKHENKKQMKGLKTLKEIKNEFKDTDKETIIEMFYNTALKLVKIENKLDEVKDIFEEEEL